MTAIITERLAADKLGAEKSGPEKFAPGRRAPDRPAPERHSSERHPPERLSPERLGDVGEAAANAVEGEIREFVRRDVAFLRRQRNDRKPPAIRSPII